VQTFEPQKALQPLPPGGMCSFHCYTQLLQAMTLSSSRCAAASFALLSVRLPPPKELLLLLHT
jgi:hypothetical protein